MAGYFLYSLDWPRVQSFMQSPSDELVRLLAQKVSDLLDDYDAKIEDDDPLADWPSEIDALSPILRSHVKKADWYADLSDTGKGIWEQAFTALCENEQADPFNFKCESDGVYWNIVEEAVKFHALPNDRLTEKEITHFGSRPFRYWHSGKLRWEDWRPSHSMHTPDEVAALTAQFEAAEDAIRNSRHSEAEEDYEELMPVLDKLKARGRVLYVSVDT